MRPTLSRFGTGALVCLLLDACSADPAPPEISQGVEEPAPGTSGGPEPGAGPGMQGVAGGPALTPGGTPGTETTDPAVPPGAPPSTPGTDPTGVMPPPAPAGTASCANTDLDTLPMDATGWVARECNNFGIQGAWYCYDDGINPSGCTTGTAPYVAGEGMCLTGSTTVDPDFAAWGAGMGLGLNESGEIGGAPSVKSPFDAAAAGIEAFDLVLTGDSGGLPIRINFTSTADPAGVVSPYWQVPGVGSYTGETAIKLSDAVVPSWAPNAGETVNPSAVYDIQIQVVGGEVAADYHVCVESLRPSGAGATPTPNPGPGTLMNYGSAVCDNFSTITLGSSYMVQNNAYNGASHCIQATWDNGANAGFSLSSVSANAMMGGAPASYPSLVYGWHVDGRFYGGYTSAKQLSAIGSVPSNWSFTVPGTGRYNASYDNWLHPSAAPPNESGTLEHMVWLNYRETTPIGTAMGTVELAGTTWEVWYGPNLSWNTVTYKRATNTTSVTGFDLLPFFQHSVAQGYAQASDYLLGIQAGFEIWESNQSFATTTFSVSVQ